MKRFLFIGLALVMLALPAQAQDWPASFAGDQIETMEAMKIQAYLDYYQDMNPWGSIDFTGTNFYFGTLDFEMCDGENLANIVFYKVAGRRCVEPAWGTPLETECMFTRPRRLRTAVPYSIPWNEDAKAYVIYHEFDGVGMSVTVLTIDNEAATGILQMGVLVDADGVYKWSENYTHSIYMLAPKTASRYVTPPRQGGGDRLEQ